jgi:hypothetical protein
MHGSGNTSAGLLGQETVEAEEWIAGTDEGRVAEELPAGERTTHPLATGYFLAGW